MKAVIERIVNAHNAVFGIADIAAIRPRGYFTDETGSNNSPDFTLPLEGAKSVVVIGVPYYKAITKTTPNEPYGRISMHAVGEDYHRRVRRILNEIGENLGGEFYALVDTGAIDERALAASCGIGLYARNNLSISPVLGTFFNIGYLLTRAEIEPTPPLEVNPCDNCGLCVKACPTGALDSGYNSQKCVSYLTQKSGDLTESESAAIGEWLYGCDICQTVCPKNAYLVPNGEFDPYVPLSTFLNMTNAEFKTKYGDTAIFWRRLKTFKRNAEAILQNKAQIIGNNIQ